mmetsp:Transcript_27933/g.79003  ORF Transcript_27933/g.79003 Transcript_27933/m.79003 type:complete len:356 (+) Transcript_27933:199-1266(+)
MEAATNALTAYKEWVKSHSTFVSSLEGALQSAVWLLPDRFSDSELKAEALNAALGLLSLYHSSIIDDAGDQPPGRASWPLLISALQQAEVLVEIGAEQWASNSSGRSKYDILCGLELIKLVLRVYTLHGDGGRILLDSACTSDGHSAGSALENHRTGADKQRRLLETFLRFREAGGGYSNSAGICPPQQQQRQQQTEEPGGSAAVGSGDRGSEEDMGSPGSSSWEMLDATEKEERGSRAGSASRGPPAEERELRSYALKEAVCLGLPVVPGKGAEGFGTLQAQYWWEMVSATASGEPQCSMVGGAVEQGGQGSRILVEGCYLPPRLAVPFAPLTGASASEGQGGEEYLMNKLDTE